MTNPEVFFNAVAGIAISPEAAAIRDDYLRAFLVEQILEEKADRDAEPCVYVAPAWDVPSLTSRLGGLSVSDRRGLLDLFETHGAVVADAVAAGCAAADACACKDVEKLLVGQGEVESLLTCMGLSRTALDEEGARIVYRVMLGLEDGECLAKVCPEADEVAVDAAHTALLTIYERMMAEGRSFFVETIEQNW